MRTVVASGVALRVSALSVGGCRVGVFVRLFVATPSAMRFAVLVFSVRFRALVVSSVRFRTVATASARFFIGGFRRFAAFGQRIAGNFGLEQAFYFVERETIFLADEGNGTSGASGASRSADAVHVVFVSK